MRLFGHLILRNELNFVRFFLQEGQRSYKLCQFCRVLWKNGYPQRLIFRYPVNQQIKTTIAFVVYSMSFHVTRPALLNCTGSVRRRAECTTGINTFDRRRAWSETQCHHRSPQTRYFLDNQLSTIIANLLNCPSIIIDVSSGAGTNLKLKWGTRSEQRARKKFVVVPLHFLALQVQLV